MNDVLPGMLGPRELFWCTASTCQALTLMYVLGSLCLLVSSDVSDLLCLAALLGWSRCAYYTSVACAAHMHEVRSGSRHSLLMHCRHQP